MKPRVETGGISNHINGFVPPRSGDAGPHICHNCEKHFTHSGNRLLFDLIRNPFVRCPECGSLNTERDPKVRY